MAPNGQVLITFDQEPRREAAIVPLHATPSEAEWFEYGQPCEESKDYSEAIDAYQRAISAESRFAAAWVNLGNAPRMLGQLAAAAAAY